MYDESCDDNATTTLLAVIVFIGLLAAFGFYGVIIFLVLAIFLG